MLLKQEIHYARASTIIADKMPVTVRDKVLAVRRMAMLLNPKTLISRNAGGNFIFSLVENVKDIPGTAFDIATKAMFQTDWRTTTAFSAKKYVGEVKGLGKGARDILSDVKNKVDTSPTRHEMSPTSTLDSTVGKFFDVLMNKVMQAGDRTFYEAARMGRIGELETLGMDTTSKQAVEDIRLYALERVFQNDSKLAASAIAIRDHLGLAGNIIIPFAQTPANIADKIFSYTPLAIYKTIKLAGTVKDSAFDQKQFVDSVSRMFTGTGLLYLGYLGAKAGLLFGGGRDDDEKVISAEEKKGQLKYSIKIDGGTYTFDTLTPIGVLVGIGADIYEVGKGKTTFWDAFFSGLETTVDVIFQQSYLEGLAELLGTNNGGSIGENVAKMLAGIPASFVPSAFAMVAKQIDNVQRETYDANMMKQMLNKVMARTPGLSLLLEPKIGADGQPQKYFQDRKGAGALLENILSPGFVGQDKQNGVDKALNALYSATNDKSVLPDVSRYTTKGDLNVTANTVKYAMTPKEWGAYRTTAGQQQYAMIEKFVTSVAYADLTNEERAKYVNAIQEYSAELAKKQLVEGRGATYEFSNKDLTAALDANIPIDAYYKAYNLYQSYSNNKEMSASDKANNFAHDVETDPTLSKLDSAKIGVLEKQLSFASYIPQDADTFKKYQALGISDDKSIEIVNALANITPEAGKEKASTAQKVQTIYGMYGISSADKVKLIGDMYTSDTSQSLLSSVNNADKLVKYYTRTEDTNAINMNVPSAFSKSNVTYTLSNSGMEYYKKVYVSTFNSQVSNYIWSTFDDKTIANILSNAKSTAMDAAKAAVLRDTKYTE